MIPRQRWAGGYNYQRNLFSVLHQYCQGEITPIVFAGERDDSVDLESLGQIPGVETARSAAFDPHRMQLPLALLLGCDQATLVEFQKRKVDAVFEAARFFGWRLPYPTVAWIPDLQHRRLPQLFSATARWKRELGFRTQIASGRWIMLRSDSALRDFSKFYPKSTGQTSVVRFACQPLPELLTANPSEIVKYYELPSGYFYLPNQFWSHKNHQVVIEALAILTKRGINAVVTASGSNRDLKEQDYFDTIMHGVAERGLKKNFRYLGMIPLPHVYALMRATTGLINPSRFEGWSTTVEEAKSFEVPMILSDLDVHREQAAEKALYFGVDDPKGLADQLAKLVGRPSIVRNLATNIEPRAKSFARDFVLAVRSAIGIR
jgi:glycosyltransferase involved in cell wall biosynthesis